MTQFEVEKSYHAGFDANNNLGRKYKVIKRTPKYIFVVNSGKENLYKLKVQINIDNEEYVEPSKTFPLGLYSELESGKVKNRHKFEVGKFYYLADYRWTEAIPVTSRRIKILSIEKKTATISFHNIRGNIYYESPTRTEKIKISSDGLSEYIQVDLEEYYASLCSC